LKDLIGKPDFKKWILTPKDELQKHTLEIKKYWIERNRNQDIDEFKSQVVNGLPDHWKMLKGINLYSWQKECVNAWFENNQGTIKVVTGAGKTILALAIIEQLQKEEKGLCVAIVVPTIVLLNQWKEEILSKSNLPEDTIGLLGAGYNGSFNERTRILICVLKSAAAKLPDLVNKEIGERLLLVVDECHRAGSAEMRQIFNTKRKYNLGLSATPEREYYDEERDEYIFSSEYDLSLLGRELGPIVYEMTLKEAFEKGILPKFELRHFALPLASKERQKYDSLSRTIQELRDKLKDAGRDLHYANENALFSWCQGLAKKESPLGDLARQFIGKTGERKRLLYRAKARSNAVIKILKNELKKNPDAQAVLFHESIEEVMELFLILSKEGLPVVAENSKLPENLRENSIELFRKGIAKVIVSARSLIEGFNVPSADIGIIVASNTSVRQRIQTLGRVLRKGKVGENDKNAVVYVLYMDKTTDEYIYEKTDWNKIIGAERNRYFYWDLKKDPLKRSGPPREPRTKEKDITEDMLVEGEEYPGEYEGILCSSDSRGNVLNLHNVPAINPQGIPDKIYKIKRDYGRFKMTPQKKYVLVLKPDAEGWQTIYVTRLKNDFIFEEDDPKGDFDYKKAQPGDMFPRGLINDSIENLFFKQRRGEHTVTKKHSRGELYVRVGEKAEDKTKGENASLLIERIKKLLEKGFKINRLLITKDGHVVFLEGGQYYYITTFPEGLEFPEM
jgi:superfamily II DNA or RNA helicase